MINGRPWWQGAGGLCTCICHEQSELSVSGEGVSIHSDRCVCNGGTGYTKL